MAGAALGDVEKGKETIKKDFLAFVITFYQAVLPGVPFTGVQVLR